MQSRYFTLVFLYCFFILSSCNFKVSSDKASKNTSAVDQAYKIMKGSYSSAEQSSLDSTYYNISLHMYPIWTGDKESKWLYVEQALYSKQDEPYRVRIYELKENGLGQVASKVYRLKDQDRFLGKWSNPSFFNNYGKEILEEREGCTVFLKREQNGQFTGSTKEQDCKSTLRGASYASSIVTVYKDKIVSWDQGFDSEGNQVWGATKAGYIFIRE